MLRVPEIIIITRALGCDDGAQVSVKNVYKYADNI
jgi:hypothetical protein